MKSLFLYFFISISFFTSAQRTNTFFYFGIDYRLYPIDIENVPAGPLPANKGLPQDDSKFWKVMSLHGKYGLRFEKNWLLSTTLYGRYNLLHREENINYSSPSPTVLEPPQQRVKEKKNLKFDFFIDIEKRLNLKKENFFFASVGLGFTNINSGFDITLTDSVESIPFDTRHYKGMLLHFGPRVSFGYQHKKIKASLDTYLIEGPDLNNLTSLWLGASISYELFLKRKKNK